MMGITNNCAYYTTKTEVSSEDRPRRAFEFGLDRLYRFYGLYILFSSTFDLIDFMDFMDSLTR
jgi:hypothetical protein